MPNWCDNVLLITLPKNHRLVNKFCDIVDKAGEPFGLLNLIYPMPKHQPDVKKPNAFFATGGLGSEEQKLYGRNNWYDWSVENWGTKWDIDSHDIDCTMIENEDSLTFEMVFQSAWAPPLQALHKSGLSFDLYYYESGMAFAGYASDSQDNYLSLTDDVFKNTFENKDDYRRHLKKTILGMGVPESFFTYYDVDYLFYHDLHDTEEDYD